MAPRPYIFCIVPAARADELLEPLRAHFADDPHVGVLVERRRPEEAQARWVPGTDHPHRRAPAAERDAVRALPPPLRADARHLRFVQRLEPLGELHQDTGTEELIAAIHDGDPAAASELWWRSAERVHMRLRARLGDLVAEAAGRRVLGRILDELEDYDPKDQPFAAWLDQVVDRYAADAGAP